MFLFFALSCYFRRTGKQDAFTQYTPTLLTTTGILGTFFGIVAGLLAFDVTEIDGSIQGLLSGMKTAFLTSLIGMLLSISYKLLGSTKFLSPRVSQQVTDDQIGVSDIYRVMIEQRDNISALNQAVGGGDESSLTGQLKLLRSDFNDADKQSRKEFDDFQEKLWIKLQDFADMMSRSATEQVINALKDVIIDFNEKLTEQFGDNFKELNAAVKELVQWQENYRQQLNQMIDQYQQGVQAITKTEAAVSHISEESRAIPATMGELKSVMEVNQHQLEELQRHLEAFRDIRDRAVEAVPGIRAQIDEAIRGMNEVTDAISKEIGNSVKTMSDAVIGSSNQLQAAIIKGSEEFVESSRQVHQSLQGTSDLVASGTEKSREMLNDALNETNSVLRNLVADLKDESQSLTSSYRQAGETLTREMESVRNSFEQGLTSMRQQLGEEFRKMAEQQAQENQRVLAGMSHHADNALKDTGEAVQKQVKMLDDALSHELNRVMNEMGRALTTISGKFTQDYQKLVNEMHRVIRMGEAG